jgi:hypothetical protein
MGVRLYDPIIGRFLSTDPVYGGNETAYSYPSDPVDSYDLDGRRCGYSGGYRMRNGIYGQGGGAEWGTKCGNTQHIHHQRYRHRCYQNAISAGNPWACDLLFHPVSKHRVVRQICAAGNLISALAGVGLYHASNRVSRLGRWAGRLGGGMAYFSLACVIHDHYDTGNNW